MKKEEIFKIDEVSFFGTKYYHIYILRENILRETNWIQYDDQKSFSTYEQAEEWLRNHIESSTVKHIRKERLKWKSNN